MHDISTKLRGLYVITDPALTPREQLVEKVKDALIGGARIVQYRNKLASFDEQVHEAKILRELTQKFGAQLFINDSVELCLASDADGVHLGQKDGALEAAKQQLGDKLLGVTCHNSLELAQRAINFGADYCAFGALYSSPTKPSATPCSLATLASASKLPVPICAIGGITSHNASTIVNHGASMLALISGVFGQPDVSEAAQSISSLFEFGESNVSF